METADKKITILLETINRLQKENENLQKQLSLEPDLSQLVKDTSQAKEEYEKLNQFLINEIEECKKIKYEFLQGFKLLKQELRKELDDVR